MTTAVAALAIPGMPWCSASQYRLYPHRSACFARSRVLRKDSAAVPPRRMGDRSRTENGTSDRVFMVLLGARVPPRRDIPPTACRVTSRGPPSPFGLRSGFLPVPPVGDPDEFLEHPVELHHL